MLKKRQHLPAIHAPHRKGTANLPVEAMPVPDSVTISMSQHIGAPCKPTVEVGDLVKVGQVIGDSDAFVCAPIHASVSGKVTQVGSAVTIKADKKQSVAKTVKKPVIKSREDFLKAVRDCGLVGLGGAAFPTHVKFAPKNLADLDTFIVNGAECEPYITVDDRNMRDNADCIIKGCIAILHWLGISHCVIGVEANKPEAVRSLREAISAHSEELKGQAEDGSDAKKIEVLVLRACYPQGAEKVIIYEVTGRVLDVGKLPADVGVIVSNVTSVSTLETYLETGMPLVSKCITVDGSAVTEPKNLCVPIGTKIADVIDYCGGYRQEPRKILMGGPMMGRTVANDQVTILKNNNAILAFGEDLAEQPAATACIRCGRCVAACPLHLMPAELATAAERHDLDTLAKRRVMMCMECGSCAYVCPAKRQLALLNHMGKDLLKEGGSK